MRVVSAQVFTPADKQALAQKIAAKAAGLAEKYRATAEKTLPAAIVALPDFVPFTGAHEPLGTGSAALHIGLEAGKAAYRFSLAGREATPEDLVEAGGSLAVVQKWLSSAAFMTSTRGRTAERRLRGR